MCIITKKITIIYRLKINTISAFLHGTTSTLTQAGAGMNCE